MITLNPAAILIGALAVFVMDVACFTVFSPFKIFTKLREAYDSNDGHLVEKEIEAESDLIHYRILSASARLGGVVLSLVFLSSKVGIVGVNSTILIFNTVLYFAAMAEDFYLKGQLLFNIRAFAYRFLDFRGKQQWITHLFEVMTGMCALYVFGLMAWALAEMIFV